MNSSEKWVPKKTVKEENPLPAMIKQILEKRKKYKKDLKWRRKGS